MNTAVNNIWQQKLFEQVDAHEVIEYEIQFPDLHRQKKMCRKQVVSWKSLNRVDIYLKLTFPLLDDTKEF